MWNDCRVYLQHSGTYDFTTDDSKWRDASISCDANGYPSTTFLRLFEKLRRIPNENYFKLIGAVDRSTSKPIVIGKSLTNFSPRESGQLFCFANDVAFMYWNNHGSIFLTITRK